MILNNEWFSVTPDNLFQIARKFIADHELHYGMTIIQFKLVRRFDTLWAVVEDSKDSEVGHLEITPITSDTLRLKIYSPAETQRSYQAESNVSLQYSTAVLDFLRRLAKHIQSELNPARSSAEAYTKRDDQLRLIIDTVRATGNPFTEDQKKLVKSQIEEAIRHGDARRLFYWQGVDKLILSDNDKHVNNTRIQRAKGGRPRNLDDEWARIEVRDKGRAPDEVYPEWLNRIGDRAKKLIDPHDSFSKAIRVRRKKPEKID